MDETRLTTDERQWFVMHDLKRRNAKQPAYLMFKDKGMEFFTPMVHKLLTIHGKREDREVPFMQDLLFVKETKEKRGSRNLVGIAIQLSDSEQEKLLVGYSMLISPEKFDFGVE